MRREQRPVTDKKRATEYCLRILMMRDYSSAMIKEKLKLRGCGGEIADEVISGLRESGYIDDREYASNLIKSLISRKKGRKYIEYELGKRGIERELAEELLDENYTSSAFEALESELQKTGKPLSALERKDRGKIINKLMRMGYSYDEISDCFGRMKDIV